jgi:hypothetical protein
MKRPESVSAQKVRAQYESSLPPWVPPFAGMTWLGTFCQARHARAGGHPGHVCHEFSSSYQKAFQRLEKKHTLKIRENLRNPRVRSLGGSNFLVISDRVSGSVVMGIAKPADFG